MPGFKTILICKWFTQTESQSYALLLEVSELVLARWRSNGQNASQWGGLKMKVPVEGIFVDDKNFEVKSFEAISKALKKRKQIMHIKY